MEPDKIQHLAAGAAIAGAAKGLGASDLQALTLSALSGVAKEALDATGYGTPDPWDAVATLLGGLLILALLSHPTPNHPPEPRPSAGPSFNEVPLWTGKLSPPTSSP